MFRCPFYKYSFCSLSNILSSWFQYEALKFVSFPTQVLAKACKVIPVMLMGKVVSGNKYPLFDWATAAQLGVGTSIFLLSNHDGKLRNIFFEISEFFKTPVMDPPRPFPASYAWWDTWSSILSLQTGNRKFSSTKWARWKWCLASMSSPVSLPPGLSSLKVIIWIFIKDKEKTYKFRIFRWISRIYASTPRLHLPRDCPLCLLW